MPLRNLAKKHFSDEEKQQLDGAIAAISSIVKLHDYTLTSKERSQYGKVGNQKRLLIEKVRDTHHSQPALSSPDVDWNEFEADYLTRHYAALTMSKLEEVMTALLGIRILHDYDNLKDALTDYRYAGYKHKFGNQPGYENKIDSMKGFFPKTGKKKSKEE